MSQLRDLLQGYRDKALNERDKGSAFERLILGLLSKGVRIVWYKKETDPTDGSGWPEPHEWLVRQIEKFNTVVQPLVRELT